MGEKTNDEQMIDEIVWTYLQTLPQPLYRVERTHTGNLKHYMVYKFEEFMGGFRVYPKPRHEGAVSRHPELATEWENHVATILYRIEKRRAELESVKNTPTKKAGRPHLDDDVWAWKQIHKRKRDPFPDVYEEWLQREGVISRNLEDPKRQFKRFLDPNWL
jgi:hypothetical protein